MRAAVLGWLALCAATAVRCASPQIVYQLQSDREPDLVDQLVGEARERNIPLDSELRPTDVERHSASFAWGVCGGSELAVQVQSIALNPDPPVKGQNLTVHGKGTLHTEVKNGTFIDLSVRVGFLRIFSQRVDVCEALKENDVEIQCPLAPGVYDVKHTAELPAHIPPAKYSVHVTGETHDGKPLACLDVALSFSMYPCAFMDSQVRFLLASDTHLGYLERDPVRGNDSFEAFREVLEIARAQDVDFILLGGDLFHENKPSRATMHRTMAMLREYTFGERAVSVELLSDPHDAQRGYPFPAVNYEDPNLNVSIPIFSIHGNHDDPQGSDEHGPLSALDMLAAAGLINYFGRLDLASETSAKRKAQGTDDMIAVRPVLLRKGDTRIALYGMGNIKDERLSYELKAKHVCMYRPAEDPDDWFNLLVVHQNRAAHNPRAFIPESAFDDSVDLVVWGHEHEQRILPESVSEKNYYISQPGSSVATSLSPGETVEKCVAIVHVDHKDFKIEPIALQSVRPFVMKDISLPTEAAAARLDPSKREDVTKLLRKHVDSLISAAERAWEERVAAIPQDARRPQPLPLVRLRVAYDTQIPLGNLARFGHEFAGRIANPKDVVQLQLKRSRQTRDNSAGHVVRLDKDMIPAEKLERIQLSSLVLENVRLQNFDLLDAAQLQRSVMGYVEKDEYFLQHTLSDIEAQLAAEHLDETQLQAELERVSAQQRSALAALDVGDTGMMQATPRRPPPSARTARPAAPRPPVSSTPLVPLPPRPALSPSPEPEVRTARRRVSSPSPPSVPPSAPPSAPPTPLSSRAAALSQLGTARPLRRRRGDNVF